MPSTAAVASADGAGTAVDTGLLSTTAPVPPIRTTTAVAFLGTDDVIPIPARTTDHSAAMACDPSADATPPKLDAVPIYAGSHRRLPFTPGRSSAS